MFVCSEELVAEQLERLSEEGRFLLSLPSSSPLELESESREVKLRTRAKKQIKACGKTTSPQNESIELQT